VSIEPISLLLFDVDAVGELSSVGDIPVSYISSPYVDTGNGGFFVRDGNDSGAITGDR